MAISVELKNITFRYGKQVVFRDYSLNIKEGSIMGIVGPSGCGKTTVMRALCGFIRPESGEVLLGNTPVFSASQRINIPPERRGIGVVFQDYAVWPHYSVWDNVCYPLKKQKRTKEDIAQRAQRALEQVDMAGYGKHMPAQLSGGQQQRVAIARALVTSEELIILDEPITNLDAKLREEMIIEIRGIQQEIGTTILFITHDQETALRLCDNIAVMAADGQISQLGTPEDIIKRPANRFVYTFFGIPNFIKVYQREGRIFTEKGDHEVKGFTTGLAEEKLDMGVRHTDIVFDEDSNIKGTLKSQVFLGNKYNYFVDFYGQEIRIERDARGSVAREVFKEGEKVGLKFLHSNIYPREEEGR
jgi:iron(III) transport system ATP-binding protein